MSLADELLADLEEIENDADAAKEEIKVKEEPSDDFDFAQDAVEEMEIDESVRQNGLIRKCFGLRSYSTLLISGFIDQIAV